MKKLVFALSMATVLFFAACSEGTDNPSKDEGGEQVQDPVMNSGPETEAERSTDAVRDSASSSSDSTGPSNSRPDSLITP